MGKVILAFLALTVLFYIGFGLFRNLSEKDKWSLTKQVGYAIICSVMSILTLTVFVLIF